MTDLYEAFGILNLFCPYRPDGSYMFKMNIYEERMVCKILCELAKAEGWQYFKETKMNGKPIEVDFEFL